MRTATVSSPALVAIGMASLFFMMMVSGPGQKASRQLLGSLRDLPHHLGQVLQAGNMDDQRVVLRAALGLKDLFYRRGVGGVRGKAVDGLGGDAHGLPRAQQPRRFVHCLRPGGKQFCLHSFRLLLPPQRT